MSKNELSLLYQELSLLLNKKKNINIAMQKIYYSSNAFHGSIPIFAPNFNNTPLLYSQLLQNEFTMEIIELTNKIESVIKEIRKIENLYKESDELVSIEEKLPYLELLYDEEILKR